MKLLASRLRKMHADTDHVSQINSYLLSHYTGQGRVNRM
jgi:hypothetical protein